MQLIGLTGGIASGKSTVARQLSALGAVIVDADQLAREVVAPESDGLAAIVREFGEAMITADGSLDRAALGAIVFTDPARREALNAITHPAVWKLATERISAAEAANPDAIIVYDVPLLVEASANRPIEFDLVVVVQASADTRIARLVSLRGMTQDDAAHRIASQASDADRLAVADVVISTDGSIAETRAQVDALWKALSSLSA